MNELRELSLFSGYGGFSLGLRLARLQTRTVMYVEWERYPQEIIKARIKDGFLDDAPIWGDISTLDGWQLRGLVDLITGGFPCQPHSVAGLKQGADDKRNLWPETLRIIREVGSRYVLLENVPGILSASSDGGIPAYGGTVVGELASLGYSVHWRTLGADDVGAPHRRKRWWCIAVLGDTNVSGRKTRYAQSIGSRARPECLAESNSLLADTQGERYRGGLGSERGAGERIVQPEEQGWGAMGSETTGRSGAIPTWPPSPGDTDGWGRVLRERPDLAPALEYTKGRPQLQPGESSPVRGSQPWQESGWGQRGLDGTEANDKEIESQFRGVAHGRSHRVDELKALGNGIVPAVVAEFLWRIE